MNSAVNDPKLKAHVSVSLSRPIRRHVKLAKHSAAAAELLIRKNELKNKVRDKKKYSANEKSRGKTVLPTATPVSSLSAAANSTKSSAKNEVCLPILQTTSSDRSNRFKPTRSSSSMSSNPEKVVKCSKAPSKNRRPKPKPSTMVICGGKGRPANSSEEGRSPFSPLSKVTGRSINSLIDRDGVPTSKIPIVNPGIPTFGPITSANPSRCIKVPEILSSKRLYGQSSVISVSGTGTYRIPKLNRNGQKSEVSLNPGANEDAKTPTILSEQESKLFPGVHSTVATCDGNFPNGVDPMYEQELNLGKEVDVNSTGRIIDDFLAKLLVEEDIDFSEKSATNFSDDVRSELSLDEDVLVITIDSNEQLPLPPK